MDVVQTELGMEGESLSTPLHLRVYGTPAPQGSKSAFVRGGRAIVTEGGSKTGRANHQAWRQAVATAARDYQESHGGVPLMTRPITVAVDFILSKPKSKPKWKLYPDVKPDLDKLVRAVFDSLSGIIWKDDSLVCELSASKIYGDNPGADIYISEIREAR